MYSLSSYSQSMLGSRNPLLSFSNITLMPTNIIHVFPMQMVDINSNLNGFHAIKMWVVSAYESSKKHAFCIIFRQYGRSWTMRTCFWVSHFSKGTDHCEFQRTSEATVLLGGFCCEWGWGGFQDLFLILGSSVLKSAPEDQSVLRVYTRALYNCLPFLPPKFLRFQVLRASSNSRISH